METLRYLLITSLSLSLFFAAYQVVYHREKNFRHQRIFLLASALISLLVPLLPQRIDLGFDLAALIQTPSRLSPPDMGTLGGLALADLLNRSGQATTFQLPLWVFLTGLVWLSVSFFLLLRIGFMLAHILFPANHTEQLGNYRIVRRNRQKSPYSFFRKIYLPSGMTNPLEIEQVIAHERVHAAQWHSADRILFEILTAIFWFNPFTWKMKQSLTLVHEYLADEGALKSGIDRVYYQALLVNQIAGAPLISLSSRFNHSLVKKRILMMTQANYSRKSRFSILALTPLTFAMVAMAACLNGLVAQPLPSDPAVLKHTSQDLSGPDTTHAAAGITIKAADDKSMPTKILYIIDGKESLYITDGTQNVDAEVLKGIDPNSIESVNVIKDKEMIKKYTDKKVDAVILITLKAKAK